MLKSAGLPALCSASQPLPAKVGRRRPEHSSFSPSPCQAANTGAQGCDNRASHPSQLSQEALDSLWESDLDAGAIGQDPVPVQVRVREAVTTFDWTADRDRQAACLLIQQHAAGTGPGLTEPVLLKGAAAHWPALHRWSLDWLARTLPQLWVWVRLAASMRFTYVEPRLMPLWLRFFPVSQAPSLLAHMPLSEFAMRSQRACPLPPIVYPSAAPATRQQGPQEACSSKPQQQHHVSADARQLHASDRAGQRAMADAPPDGAPQDGRSLESRGAAGGGNGEFCYMQSPLVPRLAQDCDLQAAPFSLVQGPDKEAPAMVASQNARLWISPRGAVSPLHFDSTTSFLTQVRGRKRLLFFAPEHLRTLGPYPSWHILRRRLRFDPAAPDYKRFPRARALSVTEAILEPGDVLLFPPHWSHYTESLAWSLSVTWRFMHAGQQPQPYARMRGMCFKWW